MVQHPNPVGHRTITLLMYPGQAKVNQPHWQTPVIHLKQNVLGLDVSVHDVPFVQASHCLEKGLNYPRVLDLGMAPEVVGALDDPVEELAAAVLFYDNVDILCFL